MNVFQKSKFYSKIEILFKNRNFIQKSKFYSKIEILFKDLNFGPKSTFWSKIDIFLKNRSSGPDVLALWSWFAAPKNRTKLARRAFTSGQN